jgi:hypothetical protein
MNRGVPQMRKSLPGDCLAVSRRPFLRATGKTLRVALPVLGSAYALTAHPDARAAQAAGREHKPAQQPRAAAHGDGLANDRRACGERCHGDAGDRRSA